MGNEQGSPAGQDALNAREGVGSMDSEVRRKLTRGAQYNMKVVVRGDRNTGKTQLWQRLQGKPYSPAYTPTEQIQVATINWGYKNSADVVKVEVWDCVDKGMRKKKHGLKIGDGEYADDGADEDDGPTATAESIDISAIVTPQSTAPDKSGSSAALPTPEGNFTVAALDATVVDVMRGATCAIFVFDMTKKWTWDYVVRELPAAAATGMHVLVVANFRDMGNNRVVTQEHAEETCRSFATEGRSNVHYLEASMRNAYGVKAIAAFFSLPFLDLQRQAIMATLKRNEEEAAVVMEELRVLREELTYEGYMKALQDKRAAPQQKQPLSPAEPAPASPPSRESSAAVAPATAQAVPQQQQPQPATATRTQSPPTQPEPMQSPKQQQSPPMSMASSFKSIFGKKKQEHAAEAQTQQPEIAAVEAKEDAAEEERKRQKEQQQQQKAAAEAEKKAKKEREEKEKKEKEEREKREKAEKARKEAEEKEAKAKRKAAAAAAPAEDKNAVEELRNLAKQKAAAPAVASADDFRPDEVDDSFFSAGPKTDEDGWVVPSKTKGFGDDDDDDDGGLLGGGDDDGEEETVKGTPAKGSKKQSGKSALLLGDQDGPDGDDDLWGSH